MNRYSFVKDCIKKNTTSAEFKMQDAAIDLLTEGECNISVRTLIEKAAVERSTFYAYYERLDDVLEAAGRMNSAGQYFVLLPVSSEEDNGKENQ